MLKEVVKKFFPFWDYVIDDSDTPTPPKLTTITLTENQPAVLTVEHLVNRKLMYSGIELYKDRYSNTHLLPSLGSLSPIADSSESEEIFAFIRDCLKICIVGPARHTLCIREAINKPKRLIKLAWRIPEADRPETNRGIMWQLVEGHGEDYAALSHCWGKERLPILIKTSPSTDGNIEERKEWSNANTMPQTLQDGMRIALHLGLRYIWIDCLCIIQNCGDDWAEEAKKMADYYQGAYVTIAAASSEAGAVPFLRSRPLESQPKKIRFYGPEKRSVLAKALAPKDSTTIKAKRSSAKVMGNTSDQTVSWARTEPANLRIPGQLATKAWTLQEHILSTRIIHFTDEGVRWQCRTCNLSENQRVCLPGYLQAWNQFYQNPETKRDRLQIFWRQILVDYTSRNLTHRKDILIALAGISERMHQRHGQKFLAGLWADRLVEDMCWIVANKQGKDFAATHHDDITLPTWSWISVRSPITYPIMDEAGVFTPRTFPISYGCVLHPENLDSNPFGRVSRGTILLAGPVVESELIVFGNKQTASNIANTLCEPFNTYVYQDTPLIDDEATALLGLAEVETIRRMRRSVPYVLEFPERAMRRTVYCMYLGQWTPKKQSDSLCGVEHRFVLVLARSARVPDTFGRIGMVKSDQVGERCFEVTSVVSLLIV